MVFSSIPFLYYFFPLFFFFYYLADKRFKNAVILLGSIYFYACGAPHFVCVLLSVTFLDFFIVRYMVATQRAVMKRGALLLSLSMNLGLLFYFKYSGFFVDNVNLIAQQLGCKPMTLTKVIMPIGISFYTFETITYVIDVYRGIHAPLKKFWDYQLYIILFPKLIAGPIIKFHVFADQITAHVHNENYRQ